MWHSHLCILISTTLIFILPFSLNTQTMIQRSLLASTSFKKCISHLYLYFFLSQDTFVAAFRPFIQRHLILTVTSSTILPPIHSNNWSEILIISTWAQIMLRFKIILLFELFMYECTNIMLFLNRIFKRPVYGLNLEFWIRVLVFFFIYILYLRFSSTYDVRIEVVDDGDRSVSSVYSTGRSRCM